VALGEIGIYLDGTLEHLLRWNGIVAAGSIEIFEASQIEIVGRETVSALSAYPIDPGCLDLTYDYPDDCRGYFVLHREDVR
jgi:hypothetical protein